MKKRFLLLSASLICFVLPPLSSAEEENEKESYLERAKRAYEDMTSDDKDLSEETKQWVQEDLERIGDWEYKVIEIELSNAQTLEDELNLHGAERWECFFITQSTKKLTIMFKRQSISYIQKASKLDWSRLVGGSEN
ncbi:MAG: hypothetical protein AAFX93_13210 [Verrucomicrobiota bacterium]